MRKILFFDKIKNKRTKPDTSLYRRRKIIDLPFDQEDGPVKRFQSRARISVLVDVAVSVIIS